ncbi:MAG TPA: sigma factor [Candidatus Eisenbacteria bacterium]
MGTREAQVSHTSSARNETRLETEFEDLVRAHHASLYRFALSLTRSEADASDLTQQTFLIWGSKGHQLRDRSRAKTWLFTSGARASGTNRRSRAGSATPGRG